MEFKPLRHETMMQVKKSVLYRMAISQKKPTQAWQVAPLGALRKTLPPTALTSAPDAREHGQADSALRPHPAAAQHSLRSGQTAFIFK